MLQRLDQEFIPAVLDEMTRDGSLGLVGQTQVPPWDGLEPLKLFQPVHRIFHVALLELVCDTFGEPRFDPKRIDSAGLVIRRILEIPGKPETLQGWVESGRELRGWVGLSGSEDADPDPAYRRPELAAGHPEINRRLAARNGFIPAEVAERVSPLFVVPPEVCSATKRTVLYGLVPVTSSEFSEAPP